MKHAITLCIALALPAAAKVDFARDVRPILNAHCTACHGGVKEAGDVSFIYREQALGTGKSGKRIIIPGDPVSSELMVRVLSSDPDEVMPKPEHGPRLSSEDIDTLSAWISEGAEWGEHWSFVPPQRIEPPTVKRVDWPKNEIDYYILGKLEAEGLQPSEPAGKAALLRRASLDLTGLPPSIEELDAFIANDAPDAYEEEIDRLLASPHFGERWASVWMDLARYADSEGLGVDRRRQVWKYRDWLIDAFNQDLPFDQFTIDQLAGDLIRGGTLEQKIATTFHRLTQVNDEGGTDDEEFRVSAVIDRVSTTWEVWQGLTFGCVQCHSHPYDPIKHEEFYSFMEFFNQSVDADLSEDLPKLMVPIDKAHYEEANLLQDDITQANRELHALRLEIDESCNWIAAASIEASASKAKLTIVKKDGIEEYHADANAASGASYELTFPAPVNLLTALQVEFLPLDEETAEHTPEWGAILQKISLELILEDGTQSDVELAEVIPDEANPLFDPNGSLTGKGRGWGTYSKTFGPRHATIVLKEALTIPKGAQLKVGMMNGPTIIASFPMVSKRGRILLSDDARWIEQRHSPAVQVLKSRVRKSRGALRNFPLTRLPVMQDRDPKFARSTRVFVRGNWLDKGEAIEHADTPEIFPGLESQSEKPNRLDLARWLASSDNPLTSRVAVNRFWLELFGVGIVPTPEDFGSAGASPTHPELLDALAIQFSGEMNWSMKSLLRELTTSAVYRQDAVISPAAAKRDPENRLLARGPRLRLTAEMARDAALVSGGLLSRDIGGPPSYPPIPEGVWAPFGRDDWITPEEGDPQRYRRAVYTYWKRSIPYPAFVTFDAPTREICSKRRLVSNTPLQALAVLNDPAFHECAKGLARRMKYDTEGDLGDKLALGYRVATSREITMDRLRELKAAFKVSEARYAADSHSMRQVAATPDGAAFTAIASILLNLDEAITR